MFVFALPLETDLVTSFVDLAVADVGSSAHGDDLVVIGWVLGWRLIEE